MLTPFPATRSPLPATGGFTLTELVVALSLGSVLFGAFALVVVQQERTHSELARRVRARAQLREGITPLSADLRSASPRSADIAAGAARDSSIELRTTVGVGVVCEVREQSIVPALASFVGTPQSGDTIWAYVTSDTGATWAPLPVGAVSTMATLASPCGFPALAASVVRRGRSAGVWYTLALAEPPSVALLPGIPVRVTRPVRYSLYRAPDARWYLGRREWSPAGGRFETIQPVSGPYRPYAPEGAGTSGLELAYFDREGGSVPSGSPETHRIARITVTLRAPVPPTDPVLREQRDVASVTVTVRNDR